MAAHGFVQDLSPADYAHLLQGGRLKNGQISGTVIEIGSDYVETTRVKGTVVDGETKVVASTHPEKLNDQFKHVYEAAAPKKTADDNDSQETSESTSLFGDEGKEKIIKGPHTVLLVSNNYALGNTESCCHKLKRYAIYSAIVLILLLLYIGLTLIAANLQISLLWFSIAFVVSAILLLPLILYLLSFCISV